VSVYSVNRTDGMCLAEVRDCRSENGVDVHHHEPLLNKWNVFAISPLVWVLCMHAALLSCVTDCWLCG